MSQRTAFRGRSLGGAEFRVELRKEAIGRPFRFGDAGIVIGGRVGRANFVQSFVLCHHWRNTITNHKDHVADSVTQGKLLRVTLGPDGKSKSVIELGLSQPLTHPDGMRAIGKNRLLLAENSGNMDIVTFSGPDGRTAEIRTIKSGLESTPAVTATRGTAWIAEGKLDYRKS
jgi:hypothetical protein